MPNKKQSTKTAKKISSKPTMRELAKAKSTGKKRRLSVKSIVSGRKSKDKSKRRKIIKLPNNRLGRALDKVLFGLPRYLRDAWGEIRQTTWPNRRETIRLTFAVFVFATVFSLFVSLLDFGLDKLFKHLITK